MTALTVVEDTTRADIISQIDTSDIDVVVGALTGLSVSTLSLRAGVEESNIVLREIAERLAENEAGERPEPENYGADEFGAVAYAEDIARWMDAVDEIADEHTALISSVFAIAAEVVAGRSHP